MTKKENVNKKSVLEKITPVIEQIVLEQGLIPIEISFVKENEKWFLRIYIYNQDGSITHNDCEKVTRNLDEYLDQLIPVAYYLEVSSPGLDRKLKSSREYLIFKGKKATIKLKKLINNMETKTFDVELIDYYPEEGLKVNILESNEELVLDEKNIHSVKLIAEYKI